MYANNCRRIDYKSNGQKSDSTDKGGGRVNMLLNKLNCIVEYFRYNSTLQSI